jgi:predicted transcriptional regulator
MSKKMTIGVGNLDETAGRFVETWRKAERGEKVARQERLTFDNLETLLRTLTPSRWTLLRTLRQNGPMTVRALSKALGRDYKNVHTDVGTLERVGLLSRDKSGRVMVPWDTIVAEVRLAA